MKIIQRDEMKYTTDYSNAATTQKGGNAFSYIVLTSGCLKNGGEEAGGKGEAGHPEEIGRMSGFGPLVELIDALDEIARPGGQRFHRRIHLLPAVGHSRLVNALENLLEVGRHDHEALDALLQGDERLADVLEQDVVALDLLEEDDLERSCPR